MNLPRCLSLLLVCTALTQCAVPVSAEKKASIRKVAIVNYVEPAVTRYKVGFTVFGNDMDGKVVLDELRPRMQAILEQEARARFPQVITVSNPPELPRGNMLTGRALEIDDVAVKVGKQTGADAVLMVIPFPYYPYGTPSYMTAAGLGYWHVGRDSAYVMCYARTALYDGATGKWIGNPRAYSNQITKGLPEWKERFTIFGGLGAAGQ